MVSDGKCTYDLRGKVVHTDRGDTAFHVLYQMTIKQ